MNRFVQEDRASGDVGRDVKVVVDADRVFRIFKNGTARNAPQLPAIPDVSIRVPRSAYLRLDDTGKSPRQLVEHCASAVTAAWNGIDSVWPIASDRTDHPTITQTTDVMKLFMVISCARQLRGIRSQIWHRAHLQIRSQRGADSD
jgi:hypothetical protein